MAVAWLLRPFVLSLTALVSFLPLAGSVTESESLLKFKQSLTEAKFLESWVPNSEPCGRNLRWVGLICKENGVFGLKLERMGLAGIVDVASLTGLPDYFAGMGSLKKVWLSNNEFSGPIPLSLATKLPNLIEIHLENNKFDGPIPNFAQQSLVQVDFSNNQLTGEVTVAGSGNDSDKSGSGRKGSTAYKPTNDAELVMVNREKGVFGLTDLMNAAAEVMGSGVGICRTSSSSRPSSGGNVGSMYKAVMGNGVALVVKRVTVMNQMNRDVFDKEIRRLGSLRHTNVLTPLAYHFRPEEKLLVSEFIPNLSLLHTELGFLILPHGNLKSSNVLLSSDGEPLISEFGYHRLINPEAQTQSLVAYRSPESDRTGTVSAKSDVYCVGVVILEILTGKFPSQYAGLERAGGTDVVEWVGSAAEHGGWMELLHPTVASAASESGKIAGEVERILRVGVRCTGGDPDLRPEMKEIVEEITTSEESKDEFVTIT